MEEVKGNCVRKWGEDCGKDNLVFKLQFFKCCIGQKGNMNRLLINHASSSFTLLIGSPSPPSSYSF